MKDLKQVLFDNMYRSHGLAHNKELKTTTSHSYIEGV